jgi:hypothetical protein
MTGPFGQFDARIAEAANELSLRTALGEIGLWRAQRLMDIPAQRQAAYALSVVYEKLGEARQAAHEAEQLVALCKTTPVASREESQVADQHLWRLTHPAGTPAPKERAPRQTREERRAAAGEREERRSAAGQREERGERPERGGRGEGDGWDAVLALAADGKWEAARAALPGRKGVRSALFFVWADLSEALALRGKARDEALEVIRGRLGEAVVGRRAAPATKEGPARGAPNSALERLIGHALPNDRDAYVSSLHEAVEAHPERSDEVAALALREHVERFGPRKPAPWLFGLTAIAKARGASPQTDAAISDLSVDGAYAVTAYAEQPFQTLVDALRGALASGLSLRSLRRGVLRRDEPDDRRLWTMRVGLGGGEVMVVAAANLDVPYGDEMAAQLARRVAELDPQAIVIAPGSGHVGFRAGAMALGLTVSETLDPDVVLHRARGRAAAAPKPEPTRTPRVAAERPERAERKEGAEEGDRKASPVRLITRLIGGASAPSVEDYAAPLGELRWVGAAFPPVRRSLQRLSAEEGDRRLATLLLATHAALSDDRRVPEATTVALRVASAVPGGEVSQLLSGEGPVAARFGGPGFAGVAQLAATISEAGLSVDRVLHGVTRKEAREHAALEALEADPGGLWRLVVRQGDVRVEVWWLEGLTEEGQATVPLLALQVPDAVVVLPEGSPLAAWYSTLGGAPAQIWDGGPAVVQAVTARLATATPGEGAAADLPESDDPTAEA